MTEQPPSASKEALNLATRIRERYFAPGNEHVLELSDAGIEIDALIAQRVSAETERCIEIIQAARAGEVDRDWRAIISMIECGRTAEQIKGDASS